MKKKIIVLILVVMLVCVAIFSGCDTENGTFLGSNNQITGIIHTYTNAYVKIGEEWVDLEILTWKAFSNGTFQLKLTNGTILSVHSANCILYNGELPISRGGK